MRSASRDCQRPWQQACSWIDSFTALYLCIGNGYRVLRSWKKTPSLLLGRQILTLDDEKLEAIRSLGALSLVPIPHSPLRSRQLGGSPPDLIARWLSSNLRYPICPVLCAPHFLDSHRAKLGLWKRVELESRNRLNLEELNKLKTHSVLLIDDFMTSGKTLQSAARVLKSAGVTEVHAFCLGARPRLHTRKLELFSKQYAHLPQ